MNRSVPCFRIFSFILKTVISYVLACDKQVQRLRGEPQDNKGSLQSVQDDVDEKKMLSCSI